MKSVALVAAAWLIVGLVGCQPAAQPTYPTKPLEMVVQAAPGGGSDIIARTVADIMQKEKIIPQPIAVVNKAGGGGTEAYIYLKDKKGDPYYLATATVTFITNPLRGQAPYTFKDFTPIANVAMDTFVVLVREDSPHKDFKGLIEAAKKVPKSVKVGGSRVGADDHILAHLISRETGAEFNFIPFKSGAEVMTALLGGHIDVASANPGEALGQLEAKKARALAVAGEKRIATLPEVPTLKELGVNVTWTQYRGFVAPPDIPKDAQAYLEAAFEKMAKTKAWAEYLQKNDQIADFRKGEELRKYLQELNDKYDKVLRELGLIK